MKAIEKTIEERATTFGLSHTKHIAYNIRPQAVSRIHDLYREIATEQREIDINKACECFQYFLNRLVEHPIDSFRPEVLQADVKVWNEDFRNQLEEQLR